MNLNAEPGGLTILLCQGQDKQGEHIASKRYRKNGEGFVKISDYHMGWEFEALPYAADDLGKLAELVNGLRNESIAVIVRGELDEAYHKAVAANPDYLITRRKYDKGDGRPPHLVEAKREWGMFDIDGFPLHPDDDLIGSPERTIQRCIEDLLPEDMHNATFFWQLSNSCGLVEGILKVHLWCWFDRPHDNSYIRRWIKIMAPHLDHAPFNCNQPHFIADPIVEDGSDPLPVRHGWLRQTAMRPVVLPVLTEQVERECRERRKEKLNGGGHPGTSILYAGSIDDALAFMGDGEDRDGFHRPLLAAGMAYARSCQKGRPRNDREFKQKVRDAIKTAPKRADRGEDGVQKYLTNEYLDAQIEGAFRLVANTLEGMPSLKLPLRYGWAERGLWYTPRPTENDPEPSPIWVCGFFNVRGRCQNGEGAEWGIVMEWRDSENFEHVWIVPRKLLHDLPKAIAGSLEDQGLSCNFGAQKELRACLAWLATDKCLTAVSKSGWHSGPSGESFVLADGTVYGGDSIMMRPEFVKLSDGTGGTLQDWQNGIGRYCVGNSRLMLFVAAAFAGPLLDVVAEPSGGIHGHGPSSSGKSTLVFVSASAKGKGKHGAALHQWAATGNGLEALAELNCDGFLALDEIGQADSREAGDSIYRLANESGKTRMSKDITMRQSKTWRILFLSTGEVTLQQRMADAGKRTMTGMEVRMANLATDAGCGMGVFENLHGFDHAGKLADHLRTAAAKFYGTPLRAFLERLVEMRRDNPVGLYNDVKGVRSKFIAEHVPAGADGQVSRVAGRFGVIAAGGEMAIAMGIMCGQSGDAWAATARCFSDWLTARGTIGSGEHESAIRQVRHFLELHGASRFQDLYSTVTPEEFGNISSGDKLRAMRQQPYTKSEEADDHGAHEHAVYQMAGFKKRDNDKLWFLVTPEVWKQEVCKGMDGDQVAKAILERGWLDRDKGKGHYTKVVKVGKKARRFYAIDADVLCGDDE